jgi:hypothetical protein
VQIAGDQGIAGVLLAARAGRACDWQDCDGFCLGLAPPHRRLRRPVALSLAIRELDAGEIQACVNTCRHLRAM